MTTRTDFVERFTMIKETYSLTYPELSKILGIKGKSTINEWVRAGKSFPNESILALISNIFAVSLDWLLGRIDDPYSENILTLLEENYTVEIFNITSKKTEIPLPQSYIKGNLRQKKYTHGQRANLIFAALSSYYKICRSTSKTMNEEVDSALLRDCIFKIEGIDLLLNGALNTPLWDLEKAFVTRNKCKQLKKNKNIQSRLEEHSWP